jgi:hypothetical protein
MIPSRHLLIPYRHHHHHHPRNILPILMKAMKYSLMNHDFRLKSKKLLIWFFGGGRIVAQSIDFDRIQRVCLLFVALDVL